MVMKTTIILVSLLSTMVVTTAAQTGVRPRWYAHVVKSGKLLFISGQVAADATGKIVGPGMKEQMEQVMLNLTEALKSQGADFSHVVKTTTFVTSIAELRSPGVAEVRAKYMGANLPANSTVEVRQLADPAYKIEIEAIAVLP